jgi:hypothetical protein
MHTPAVTAVSRASLQKPHYDTTTKMQETIARTSSLPTQMSKQYIHSKLPSQHNFRWGEKTTYKVNNERTELHK